MSPDSGGEVTGRLEMECGCSIERTFAEAVVPHLRDCQLVFCEEHGWTALIEAREIRPVRHLSPTGGCIEKRIFLACRCRYHVYSPVLPGGVAVCPDHGDQRVISAKQVGARHAWYSEQPFTGWLVCGRCGARHPNTHYGRLVEANVYYECDCVSHHPEILEKHLAQYVQQCREHGDGMFQGAGRRTRIEKLRVLDAEWCSCGTCMDRRRGRG